MVTVCNLLVKLNTQKVCILSEFIALVHAWSVNTKTYVSEMLPPTTVWL